MEGMGSFVHELLQIIDRHVLEIDLFGAVDVGSVSKNADRHPWPGNVWESVQANQIHVHRTLGSWGSLDGSRETLVPLGVIVFQTDLEFDGLDEVAAFFSRGSKEFLDRAPDT